jgi:hypothetical protein
MASESKIEPATHSILDMYGQHHAQLREHVDCLLNSFPSPVDCFLVDGGTCLVDRVTFPGALLGSSSKLKLLSLCC